MRIAIAQMTSVAGDFETTVPRMLEFAERAREQGAELVTYPLCVLTGTGLTCAGDAEGYAMDVAEVFSRLADELPLPAILPITIHQSGTTYIDAAIVENGEVRPARLDHMAKRAAAGDPVDEGDPTLIELCGRKLGLAFTYEDLDDLKESDEEMDAVLYFSSYGYAIDDSGSGLAASLEISRFRGDAAEMDAWLIAVGSVGCYNLQVFCGSSFVLAPWGELAAQAPALEEALLVCDMDFGSEGPLASPQHFQVMDVPLSLWSAVTYGLAALAEQHGADGVAVMVDSSPESMTLAAVATDALGPTRVMAFVSAEEEKAFDSRVMRLVKNLRVDVVPVEPAGAASSGLARGGMLLAMAAYADEHNLLPLSYLDKTTLAVEGVSPFEAGFAMPFGDVYKSGVLTLTYFRNTISPVIPHESRNDWRLPAIEGLQECSTTDEGRLAFVDGVLAGFIEWQRGVSDVAKERGHAEVARAIVDAARHNMAYITARPFALALSTRTLKEARGAVGDVWHDRVRADEERVSHEALAEVVQDMLDDVTGGNGAGASGAASDEDVQGLTPSEQAQVQSDLQEILGYLKDFALEQGLGEIKEAGGEKGGPDGDPFFGSPFSEN